MKELAKEYKKSLKKLNNRISELTSIKKALEAASKAPEKDPEIIELKDRLKPLVNMQHDLQDVTREIKHYYDSWWYRSPDYSFNRRRGKNKFKYGG